MGLSPSKPPSLTENFPHNPAIFRKRTKSSLPKWRGYGGSFLRLGRWRFFAVCGCRTLFVGGKRLDMIPYACAEIPPAGTRARHNCRTLLFYRSGAKPHHIKRSHLLFQTKTSPKSTRTIQSETNFRHIRAGALGGSSRREREVWRERESSFKRTPSPSKVFPSSPRSSSLHSPLQPKGSEGGVTENGFQSGQQVTGYGERAPKQNAAGETAAAVKRQIRAVGIYLP